MMPSTTQLSEVAMSPSLSLAVPGSAQYHALEFLDQFQAGSKAPFTASVPPSPSPSNPASCSTAPFSPYGFGDESDDMPSPAVSHEGASGEKFPCPMKDCDKVFIRKYNLSVHMRRHTGETPYTCLVPGCDKKFKWRSSMAHHNKSHERQGDIKERLPIIQDKNLSTLSRRNSAAHEPAKLLAAKRSALAAVEAASKVGQASEAANALHNSAAAALDRLGNDSFDSIPTHESRTRKRARKSCGNAKNEFRVAPKMEDYPAALAEAAAIAETEASNATSVLSAPPQPLLSSPGVPTKGDSGLFFSPTTAAIAMGHGASTSVATPAPFSLANGMQAFDPPTLNAGMAGQEASANIFSALLPSHSAVPSLPDPAPVTTFQPAQSAQSVQCYDISDFWSATDLESAF